MNRKFILTLIFVLGILSETFSQATLPCKFTWNDVKTTSTSKIFTEGIGKQIYNGPCLSYAFSCAISTRYAIENPNQPLITLSDAYLDMSLLTYNGSSVENLSDYKFLSVAINPPKLPQKSGGVGDDLINEYFPEVTDRKKGAEYVGFDTNVKNCVRSEKNFILKYTELTQSYALNQNCGNSIRSGNYLTVGSVIDVSPSINSISDIKRAVIENGGLVTKILRADLPKFGNYVGDFVYHAYTIIGWETTSEGKTSWHLADSWYGRLFWTDTQKLTDAVFFSLVRNQLYRVENIKKNGQAQSNSTFKVDYTLQCNTNATPILTPIAASLCKTSIAGRTYSEFSVESDIDVQDWEWSCSVSHLSRSLNKTPQYSSILISPNVVNSVIVKVRAKKNNIWGEWRTINRYLVSTGSCAY